ncbi:hypothetical protein MSG28_004174 [Choristoneura fumiferana]|uniref:Uncharacterized protein n=1 Tax=Choristoneura fumiferana TaxID=7141 RepID=A0ACC0KHV3_CHOFU|nr:hypothetical protein MSG28_004174 [Choristoneura fumiferana]
MAEPSSYEMEVRTEEVQKEKPKLALSSGKIFYNPGVIEEETDETSAYDSSMVESPMLGVGFRGSGFLRPPMIHTSSSLHRIPTYSSSIGQSTVYRQDTCRRVSKPLDLKSLVLEE